MQFPVPSWPILNMEQCIVHWELTELLPMETLVVSHVTLVMSYLVVTLEPVKEMGAGVVLRPCVEEVGIF